MQLNTSILTCFHLLLFKIVCSEIHVQGTLKARQKAFCRGGKNKYKLLCENVSNLILKAAKGVYYLTKAKDARLTNPAKWYKTIYSLLGAQLENRKSPPNPSEKEASKLTELLQRAFTKPWKDAKTDPLDINEVDHLLKHTSPPLYPH